MTARDFLWVAGMSFITLAAFIIGAALGFAVLGVACLVAAVSLS